MNAEAAKIIERLGLAPLPEEGGFFRQTWLSLVLAQKDRKAGSAIYFLMTKEDFSALHQLLTDEIWHFYDGDPVTHVQLNPRNGRAQITQMGPDVLAGQTPQLVVPGGVWQGARLAEPPGGGKGWALLGCTMSPAWDERGFKLADRAEMLRVFPDSAPLFTSLIR